MISQKHFSRPTLDDGTLSENTGVGARVLNKRTAEVLAAAEASRATPLAYMLEVMRDETADEKRRDAMAMATAPYLHSKLSAIDAKLSPVAAEPGPESHRLLSSAQPAGFLTAAR